MIHDIIKQEKYLFEICKRLLDYFNVKYEYKDLANFIMLELLNVKK